MSETSVLVELSLNGTREDFREVVPALRCKRGHEHLMPPGIERDSKKPLLCGYCSSPMTARKNFVFARKSHL